MRVMILKYIAKSKEKSVSYQNDSDSIKKQKDREKRGQVPSRKIERFNDLAVEDLMELLNSPDPKERTITATIIGKRKYIDFVLPLCEALKKEKSLYSRIAISEALGQIGEPAVVPLISLLGKIGNNQEKELPLKYFDKRNYP